MWGSDLFAFFSICEEELGEGDVATRAIEDVRGAPLVVTDGRRRDGQPFFRIELPGGIGLTSGDALALAAETTPWRRFCAERSVDELRRRIGSTELFTCFTLRLDDEPWDGDRTPSGWPAITVGCPCGRMHEGS